MKTEWNAKKVSLGGAIIASAATLIIGLTVGLNWNNIMTAWGPYLGLTNNHDSSLNLSTVNNLYNMVDEFYDGTFDKNTLIEGAKKGMVSAIGDVYTEYMNSSEATEYKASLEGEVGAAGVGVLLGKREDYVKIIRTLPDNPARKAGVLAGDIIYAIDDEEVWNKDSSTISQKLRGDAGTKVKLTVVRDGKPKEFTLIREEINNVSAEVNYKDKTAIISVYRFSSDTGSLVASFASEIKSKGVDKIILDLRDNGGGYVNAATDLISLWVSGEKILIQRSTKSTEDITYAKRNQAVFADYKTVVLVNGSTASASEIVAGALKDHNKATIVGETTYGKGVVQRMLNVDGGALLKVTIAHWYTPNGTSINGTGIKPDIEVQRSYDQINKNVDPQMDKAYELLK